MFKIQKINIILVACILSFFASPVFATQIYLQADSATIKPGDFLKVSVFINTETEIINAIQGTVVFPDNLLKVEKINEGNSILSFWAEKPNVYEGKEIRFAGIVPGGYQNNEGLLFSVIFQTLSQGNGAAALKDVQVLLNDGKGTAAEFSVSNLNFVVTDKASAISKPEIKDNEPPELFTPEIASTPEMFEGRYFLVFATQDKGSGIDHYEIREGKGPFIFAESPYLLQNQNLDKEIAVKAVDKNGNERIIVLPPQKPLLWYQNYWILGIMMIIGFIIVGIILRKNLWQRFTKLR